MGPVAPALESVADQFLRLLPEGWRLSESTIRRARPLVDAALKAGWATEQLRSELVRDMIGARSPGGVLVERLRALPAPPPAAPSATSACAEHPSVGRRGGLWGECAGCWANRQG